MAAIPIGGDPADYDALRGNECREPARSSSGPGTITVSYVGTFMPRTEPLMNVFLEAFARVERVILM